MTAAISFAVGLAIGYLWATARARRAIALGILTGPRTSCRPLKYEQEFPAIWK